jgi:hypothetical protein
MKIGQREYEFSSPLPGVETDVRTGEVSVTPSSIDGFIETFVRDEGRPEDENQVGKLVLVKKAVEDLKAQQAGQGANKTAVYQLITDEKGQNKFIGLDKQGNLTLQEFGDILTKTPDGTDIVKFELGEKAKELILETESAKFAMERAGKSEAAMKEVNAGGNTFLLAVDKEGNAHKTIIGPTGNPPLSEGFQQTLLEATANDLIGQRLAGATGDLVKTLDYGGMNKLVALRADGSLEAINFSDYKAKSGAEAIAVDKAIQELREWQAANPGQEASKKIKVSKKISFNITLNADGSIKEIKRKKKKKQGFFAKIGSFFKKALQVLSIATMFIPGLQPIALGLRIANAVVGVVDAVRNRNWLGVLGSAAGAFGGSLANTITRGINTVSTVVNVARNGIGNAWDAISTVAGTVSSWAGGAIGRVSGYISQGASAISSFARGDGWNGAIALGNLAGSVYQDSRAANQRQQSTSNNRDTQNDQLMISLDQPLFDMTLTPETNRVTQAYEQIYGRINDRQNAVTQLIVQNAIRRGIEPTPTNINREVQIVNNLVNEQRTLGVDGLVRADLTRRGIELTPENIRRETQIVSNLVNEQRNVVFENLNKNQNTSVVDQLRQIFDTQYNNGSVGNLFAGPIIGPPAPRFVPAVKPTPVRGSDDGISNVPNPSISTYGTTAVAPKGASAVSLNAIMAKAMNPNQIITGPVHVKIGESSFYLDYQGRVPVRMSFTDGSGKIATGVISKVGNDYVFLRDQPMRTLGVQTVITDAKSKPWRELGIPDERQIVLRGIANRLITNQGHAFNPSTDTLIASGNEAPEVLNYKDIGVVFARIAKDSTLTDNEKFEVGRLIADGYGARVGGLNLIGTGKNELEDRSYSLSSQFSRPENADSGVHKATPDGGRPFHELDHGTHSVNGANYSDNRHAGWAAKTLDTMMSQYSLESLKQPGLRLSIVDTVMKKFEERAISEETTDKGTYNRGDVVSSVNSTRALVEGYYQSQISGGKSGFAAFAIQWIKGSVTDKEGQAIIRDLNLEEELKK